MPVKTDLTLKSDCKPLWRGPCKQHGLRSTSTALMTSAVKNVSTINSSESKNSAAIPTCQTYRRFDWMVDVLCRPLFSCDVPDQEAIQQQFQPWTNLNKTLKLRVQIENENQKLDLDHWPRPLVGSSQNRSPGFVTILLMKQI